jgi:hypothetical protein
MALHVALLPSLRSGYRIGEHGHDAALAISEGWDDHNGDVRGPQDLFDQKVAISNGAGVPIGSFESQQWRTRVLVELAQLAALFAVALCVAACTRRAGMLEGSGHE